MNVGYYVGLAQQMGYGNPEKESLWAECPQKTRLAIICHLLRLRNVRELCSFEDDIDMDTEEELMASAIKWSRESSLDEVPLTLAPFVFFAFTGEKFSLEILQNETDRFFWRPGGTFIDEEG